jgi:hypothetical protein
MRWRPRLRYPLISIATFAITTPADSQSVRDSAGIRIVENVRPVLTTVRAWRVEPAPIVTIGGQSADSDTINEMQLVMGVARLTDGRYAVGVQASHALRFYDARGRYLGFAGRKGEGPGEFEQLMAVRAIRGDTLFITDNGEVELFTSDGKFVGQGASQSRGVKFVYPTVVLSDGSYLGILRDDNSVPPAGRTRRPWPVARVSRDGMKIDTIGSMLSAEEVFDGRLPFGSSLAFSQRSLIAGDDGRFFVASPLQAEIVQFDLAGKAIRHIRLPARNERVSNQAVRALREWYLSMPGENGQPLPLAMRARREQSLERTVYADQFPPFGNLLVDTARNLWAQRFDYRSAFLTPGPVRTQTMSVPSTWDVLDSEGRWLCAVHLPARFTPLEIGTDYVAGLARDEDDVEQVRVYRLRKP